MRPYQVFAGLTPERVAELLEGLKAKAICEAIYESAHAGEALRYADVLSGYIEGYQREINEHWGI